MKNEFLPPLLQLWKLAEAEPNEIGADNYHFDPIGLILLNPLRRLDYWCTPTNALSFAQTGGDGVHYSFLDLGEGINEKSPIVMTVPTAQHTNLIVGSNLREFLALGARFGYFALEQLIYNREATIQDLKRTDFHPAIETKKKELLNEIVIEFGIKPWTEPEERLNELQAEFEDAIELPASD